MQWKTALLGAFTLLFLEVGWALSSRQPDSSLADGLAKKLQLLRERAERNDAQPMEFEVSEEEANAYLVDRVVDQLPEGVVDPWVKFSEGPLTAGAVLDFTVLQDRMPQSSVTNLLSGRVPVELIARVQAEDGVGKLLLDSVTLAGFPIPQSLLQEIVTAYTKSSSRPDGIRLDESFPLPLGIEHARVEKGRVFFRQGRTREIPRDRRR
jgi:hypothetical protein